MGELAEDTTSSEGMYRTTQNLFQIIFHFSKKCESVMIAISRKQNDVGKVAIFMQGDNMGQEDIDDFDEFYPHFMPLGILPVFFIVESVANIHWRKFLTI